MCISQWVWEAMHEVVCANTWHSPCVCGEKSPRCPFSGSAVFDKILPFTKGWGEKGKAGDISLEFTRSGKSLQFFPVLKNHGKFFLLRTDWWLLAASFYDTGLRDRSVSLSLKPSCAVFKTPGVQACGAGQGGGSPWRRGGLGRSHLFFSGCGCSHTLYCFSSHFPSVKQKRKQQHIGSLIGFLAVNNSSSF